MVNREDAAFAFTGILLVAAGVLEWTVLGLPLAPLSRPYIVMVAIALYPAIRVNTVAVVSLAYAHGFSLITFCQDSSPDSSLGQVDATANDMAGGMFAGLVLYVSFGFVLIRRLIAVNRRAYAARGASGTSRKA